ncbi:MAG: helix-turn-helix transcriptional regulator [Solobacterium sp.]|nr:helix-turn-helix transcriptional regulator [Solobacterium sp.]
MNDYLLQERFIVYLSRVIALATHHRFHLRAITEILSNSEFLKEVEQNDYSMMMEHTPVKLFTSMFEIETEERLDGVYNDAYWCGYVYAKLFYHFKKPFGYLFLIMPLEELLDYYPVYHEMDISALISLFEEKENSDTLLSSLLKRKKMSVRELSEKTGISTNSLTYYKKSNAHLYKGSFMAIKKIARALNVNDNTFLETVG